MSELGNQAFSRGDVVAGRFRITAGGAAAGNLRLFPAVEIATGAEVCLTLCAQSQAGAFLDRAERVAKLRHVNIAAVRETVSEAGRPVVVSEIPSGVNLGEWRRALGRSPSFAQFEQIARQLLEAVAALHQIGALHLRISPGAIFVRADGRVTLAPFGPPLGGEPGSDAFRPPELVAGSSLPPGERSDVFGCAATLTALISGRPPTNPGGIPAAAAAGPEFHSEALQALAIAASPEPADRPPSIRALAALLLDFPTAAPRVAAAERPPPPRRARPFRGGAIGFALLALAAMLFGGLYALDFSPPWRQPPKRSDDAARAPNLHFGEAVPRAPPTEPPIRPTANGLAEVGAMTSRDALAARAAQAGAIGEAAKARLETLGYVLAKGGAAPLWLKPGAGEAFRDCADCPELVVIPSGTYLPGSRGEEPGRNDGDGGAPGRGGGAAIKAPGPFALMRGEVTRGDYASFVADTKRTGLDGCFSRQGARTFDPNLSWRNPGFPQDDRHPVVCVSHDDARAYAEWMSKRAGAHYRLPSEAEYEFAARAGENSGRYFWGDEVKDLCSYANGADASARERNPGWEAAPCRDGFAWTAPVGSFRPNAFGLEDMLGNVWEWTSDCVSGGLSQTAGNGRVVCAGNADRILRGGSWSDPPQRLFLSARIAGPPAARDQIVGFRLIREIER